ncbi:Hypothetical protein PHPALM_13473, partial [Phytophthora palmivora]
MVVAFTRNPKAYNVKTLPGARLWSCIPHPITQEQLGHLQMLEASGIYSVQKPISNRPNLQHQPRFLQRLSVAPAPLQVMVPCELDSQITQDIQFSNTDTKRTDRSKKLAIQGLQLLFHCEYLALVEYIECVVPLVFVTYKLVLRQLHNAVYYPNDDDNWRISSVVNLFVFAMLEVGSFVFLNALLRNKCAFSPLYQLAFVLETQVCPVQVHLFVALIILLQYELFHLVFFNLVFASVVMEDPKGLNETRDSTLAKEAQVVSQKALWNRVEEFWNRIQVGRQGSYSVERLELLEHYCKTTSMTRVFLVCVLTPLPVLIVAVLLECLPLRSPSEGWAANWMFWVRLSFMVFTLSLAGFSQINTFIPGFNLSVAKMVTASLGICITQVGTYLLEGVVIGFPVPFMWQFGAITMAIYAPAITRLVFGPGQFEK